MAVLHYYPEMGQPRPETPFSASLAHYGKHYFVEAPLGYEMPGGRGVRDMGEYTALTPNGKTKKMRTWKLTIKAFEKWSARNDVAYEILLD